jgi:hypothetical protein
MKILWVCPFFLHPTERGSQIRTLGTLKELHKRHEIHWATAWLMYQAAESLINGRKPISPSATCVAKDAG